MKKKKTTYHLTLLEIMIVIILIGLIGSVIGVNMKGSLEEGRAFKTRQAQEQIKDILMMEIAQGAEPSRVVQEPVIYLENSGLVKNPKKFVKDGWGGDFEIELDGRNGYDVIVRSAKLKAFDAKKRAKTGQPASENEEDDQTASS